MWICTDWTYDVAALTAWGTWAAVVVALSVALASNVAAWRQRRLEGRLLAVLLYHEVVHTSIILDTIREEVLPEGAIEMAEALIGMESKIRTDLAFHIGRLPALEKSVSRLSVLPAGVAIAVGELQNAIAFFRRAEVALATESQPPDDFYPIFRQDIRDCVRLVEEARALLWVTAFPNKKGEG